MLNNEYYHICYGLNIGTQGKLNRIKIIVNIRQSDSQGRVTIGINERSLVKESNIKLVCARLCLACV